ncbi:protein kinase family protein [Blastococcus deserti]|uniref:Protein kinase family protein n=1 Tax=Blastococcus deserti TaxID=2259033 RepID=A0ABW4XBP0_9ACTN
MTSTTTGLPDRYRPIDQVGPDEPTPTGVIQCWRAKDRVLNRDVAIRVHTPAGPAAHAWISRALTAGGLATPALAMVYDASEGSGDPQAPGGAAYVVNEWIDGETLAERLARGPMPEREVRTVLRRLAEGVAEAHRVGLAVGGLTPDNVVLRPNGLVGLRAVPAATGTIDGDITALGALLEACLTGLDPAAPGPRRLTGPSDLVALVRRARSTEPGQGLSSVAAMASLLAERTRPGPLSPAARAEETDSGWLRRLRDRRPDQASDHPGEQSAGEVAATRAVDVGPVRLDPHTLPPVPPVRPVTGTGVAPGALGGDTIAAGSVPPASGAYAGSRDTGSGDTGSGDARFPHAAPPTRYDDEPFGVLDDGAGYDDEYEEPVTGETDIGQDGARRHRLVVFGLPLLALLVVVALAWWIGDKVLSVAGDVDEIPGSTPSVSAPAEEPEGGAATAGQDVAISSGDVYDPFGDGEPENTPDVPQAFDGDPATSWSTLQYRGSPAFGNLKDGVGLLLDLGQAQDLAAVTVTTNSPGATVEIRTGNAPDGDLDDFSVAADGTLEQQTQLAFDEPVSARYVLVWITGLVASDGGFSADVAEVTVQAAG